MNLNQRHFLFLFIIELVFILSIISCSCNRVQHTNTTVPAIVVPNTATPAIVQETLQSQHQIVNVYIENSGSMNGFINNASAFQDAIQRLIILLEHYYGSDNINLNYINSAVHPFSGAIVRMLEPNTFRAAGNVGSTNLNDIVRMVLRGVDENSISILVSDCIYSLVGKGTTESLLSSCKNKTMSAFLEKAREHSDLATTIVRLTSHFKGSYWDYNHPSGKASQTLDCDRPYYMCVIGTNANVGAFNNHIKVEEMRGYDDKYILSCSDFSNCSYSAMPNSHKLAMFRVTGSAPFQTLERARPHGDIFQFAISADLSSIPMSEREKLKECNFGIIQGHYAVVDIHELDQNHMHPTDRIIVENCHLTHEIVISTDQYPTDVIVGVKRNTPQWVIESNSTDDSIIQEDASEKLKTFGLKYFVEGIADAYKEVSPDKDYITKFKITINN